MNNVYRAVTSMSRPVRMIKLDQVKVERIIQSSLNRLVGERVRLVRLDSSHQTIINERWFGALDPRLWISCGCICS